MNVDRGIHFKESHVYNELNTYFIEGKMTTDNYKMNDKAIKFKTYKQNYNIIICIITCDFPGG